MLSLRDERVCVQSVIYIYILISAYTSEKTKQMFVCACIISSYEQYYHKNSLSLTPSLSLTHSHT